MAINLKDKIENIKNGETLLLGGERYDIYPQTATSVDRFYPGYGQKRNYSFVVSDKKDITIDGQGAELIFHGAVSPFNFVNCENITLKNFNIDFAVPGCVCGKVTEVTDDYFDLDFNDSEFCADVTENGSLKLFDKLGERENVLRCPIINELDGKTFTHMQNRYFLRVDPWEEGQPLSHMFKRTHFLKIRENVIRVYAERDWEKEIKHAVGNYVLFDVSGRNNVNFEFDDCTDLKLSNINMYSSLGLAVIGVNCKNFYADNVNSMVRENSGRPIAVKDDVFHLVATKGEIIIENCLFERMIDDSVNIHSFYPTVMEVVDSNSVIIEIICPQNKLLDFYRNGQKLKLLMGDYTETGKVYTVCDHSYVSDKRIKLVFEEEIEGDITGYYFDDAFDSATFLMRNCKVINTVGRVVVQTPGKSIIENCYFHTVNACIITNGRSKIYHESAPVTDLVIRNNFFDGFGIHPSIATGSTCYNPENKVIYGKITVENNKFSANGENFILLKYFDKVVLRNNTFEQNPLYRKRQNKENGGIVTQYCNDVIIE